MWGIRITIEKNIEYRTLYNIHNLCIWYKYVLIPIKPVVLPFYVLFPLISLKFFFPKLPSDFFLSCEIINCHAAF